MNSLSLIIPVHNGEKVIQKTIREYFSHFSKDFEKLEIIIVCNACTDKTEERCRELRNEIPLKVVLAPQRGKGNALTKGFRNAENEIIGFIDADNPFDLNKISEKIFLLGECICCKGFFWIKHSRYSRWSKIYEKICLGGNRMKFCLHWF